MKKMFRSLYGAALLGAIGAVVSLPAASAPQGAAVPTVGGDNLGVYRLRLGDFVVTVLSDGTASRDLPKIMSPGEAVKAAYAAAHQELPVELSINCYLIDTGSRRILIDTGAGELFGPTAGKLVRNMAAAGYGADDITDILLTHIHGDHSGGLSVGGQPVFKNAVVHVDQRDPAHWLDEDRQAQATPDQKATFAQSHQTVDPVVRSGLLKTFDGPTELFPGIKSLPERGHTPGMTGYLIESRGQRLLVWGDIIHGAEAQFADPSITIGYDVLPTEAAATRKRVLHEASAQGWLVGGAHLSFPGLGHVKDEGNGRYSWVPAPWRSVP